VGHDFFLTIGITDVDVRMLDYVYGKSPFLDLERLPSDYLNKMNLHIIKIMR